MNETAASLILLALVLAFAAAPRRQFIPATFIPRDEPLQQPWAASDDGAQMFFIR